jgi:hypothetical protein
MNASSQAPAEIFNRKEEISANFNPMSWCAEKYVAQAEKNKTVA